jgi:hypothetical protein
MSFPFPDAMVIHAVGFGPAMTARQSIQRAKKIMLDLETISPWRRPFEVSGCTKETGDMPIAADLSDFDEVVMRALQSYDDVRYYNENDPDNWKLTPDSYSPYGFGESFTNAPSAEEYKSRVSVSLDASGLKNNASRDNGVYVIRIPFFEQSQVNAAWSDPAVVYRIFYYFIDNYDPKKCTVYGSHQNLRISSQPNYTIGWLNYTREPKVADVFAQTGKAAPYRAGVLLKLGEDASVLSDPKLDVELKEIGEMLWLPGVTR